MQSVENVDNCNKRNIPTYDLKYSVKLRKDIKGKSFKMRELKRVRSEKMHDDV